MSEERRDLSHIYGQLRLSEKTQLAVERVRSSGPSRAVGSGKSNVRGRYPSRKMGMTIQFESHRNELPAIFELGHDKDVIEYYDQSARIAIEYEGMTKRRIRVIHTPVRPGVCLFAAWPGRHLGTAGVYREMMKRRLAAWEEVVVGAQEAA